MPILEKRDSVDQQPHPALAAIAANREFFSRHGSVVGSYRSRNGKTYGPYYRLAWREEGRQRSIYLGCRESLVAEVRAAMANLQERAAKWRLYDHMEAVSRRQYRRCQKMVNLHLATLGMWMKGSEVRGWRHSPLRHVRLERDLSALEKLPRLRRFKLVSMVKRGSLSPPAVGRANASPTAV